MSLETIKQLKAAGFFDPLDEQLAGLVSRMQPGCDGNLLIAAALASRAIRQGHACVKLSDYAGRTWSEILTNGPMTDWDDEEAGRDGEPALEKTVGSRGALPAFEDWANVLTAPVVGTGSERGERRTLLVREGDRLYLRRYWDYERKVEDALRRLNTPTGKQADDQRLKMYFAEPGAQEQLEAARKTIERRLSLLSGGPGTGKTTTLSRALALLAEMNVPAGRQPVVRLVAPTGKAAVRMVESIRKAKEKLNEAKFNEAMISSIPEEASTIHRLLESQYQSPYFKHDARNPVTADLVIVDEASMVDLPLMAKLLDALPVHGALMLVGDIDQLASVEPGRVYGDVCRAAEAGGPLQGCLTRLTRSWRFPEESAIGKVSRLINEGLAEEAWSKLHQANSRHLRCLEAGELIRGSGAFEKLIEEQLAGFLQAREPAEVIAEANKFRILCALRQGPFGVTRMNRRVESVLSAKGLKPSGRFYDHQLIMIRVNTPSQELYNGDVGVVLAGDGEGRPQEYHAWFPDAKTGARSIPVGLLPEYETAFAMTIHKSQGSEFPHVALILPDNADSPILTRELLYTGMTRVAVDEAQGTGQLCAWCSEASFKRAIGNKTARVTGLFACSIRGSGDPPGTPGARANSAA